MLLGMLHLNMYGTKYTIYFRGVLLDDYFSPEHCGYFVYHGNEAVTDSKMSQDFRLLCVNYLSACIMDANQQLPFGSFKHLVISMNLRRSHEVTRFSLSIPKQSDDHFRIGMGAKDFFPSGVRKISTRKDGIYVHTKKQPLGFKL